jgi:hypothetical protein
MPKLTRKNVILAKLEVTSGVDPTPLTGALNAIQISNARLTPVVQNLQGRDLTRAVLGNSDQIVANNYLELAFDVEMAGSGTAGTPPAYAPLLEACGWQETDGASDDVYTLRSTGFKNLTIYANIDGVLHEANYCAGDMGWGFEPGMVAKFNFTFRGVFVPVVDATLPVPVYTAFKKPVAVSKANTTATLHGYAGVFKSLKFALKNEFPYRNLIGFEGVTVNDRKPDGSVSMEMVGVGTKDWFASIAAGTTGALQVVHGTVPGNIVQVDASTVQVMNPQFSDNNGIQMLEASLLFMPDASGNSEITLTVK